MLPNVEHVVVLICNMASRFHLETRFRTLLYAFIGPKFDESLTIHPAK